MTRFATFIGVAGLAFVVACGPSDSGVTTNVENRLAADAAVRADGIDVTTHDGVVTLTGEVRSQVEREHVLTVARETSGVREVVDRLRIADTSATTGFEPPPAAEIDEIDRVPAPTAP